MDKNRPSEQNERPKSLINKPKSIKGQLMDNVLGKIPPQALEVEEVVLGALLLEKNALTAVIDFLKPETFYKEAHQRIFSAIKRLFAESQPIDLITVTNELRKTGELEIIGGPYYLAQLTNRVASSANIEFHSRILAEKYIQRELIRVSTEIIHNAYEDSMDALDLLDKAEMALFSIIDENFRRDYEKMDSLVRKAVEEIRKAYEQE
ncbi:MAG TPA: replicative DNA helicase, partial [Bacteroidales bacterium]|nr:replicative DNA helicase [Bacteroidales bacterium]